MDQNNKRSMSVEEIVGVWVSQGGEAVSDLLDAKNVDMEKIRLAVQMICRSNNALLPDFVSLARFQLAILERKEMQES